MKKRLISCVLALTLAMGLAPGALAAAATQDEAAQVLAALDIMVGDETGDLQLSRTITRAEFTKLVIAASPYRDKAGSAASVAPYPDVPRTHWAAPYVQAAVEAGYVTGYLDGTFRPGNTITLAEGVTMVLRLLGYQNSDFTGAYPSGQMAAYQNMGLDEGVTAGQNDPLTRADALWLFYHLMTAKTKEGAYYLNTLEPTLNLVDAQGQLDRVALVNSAMEGPVVAEGNWQSQLPFALSDATVYRDGRAAAGADIQSWDVVYWSEPMRTLWAYSKKVTGTLEQITPASQPTSVVVAGQTYTLESSEAVYALSDLGTFRTGDVVTLLLGRTGGVAAVRDASAADGEVIGLVTALKTASYTDANGSAYTSTAVALTTTSGAAATYPTDTRNLSEGDLVRVTTGQGEIQVKRLSSATLTGTFSSDGQRVAGYDLAADVEILDTYAGSAQRVYPNRLAGVRLEEGDVRYYALNQNDQIDTLILDDVTGDLHTYGVLTKVQESTVPSAMMGAYTVQVGETQTAVVTQNLVYSLSTGPCMVKGSLAAPDRIANLTEVELEHVSATTARGEDGRSYPVWEKATVYEVRSGKYYLSSLDHVNSGDYTLTGYYDKAAGRGGAIRILLAKPAA